MDIFKKISYEQMILLSLILFFIFIIYDFFYVLEARKWIPYIDYINKPKHKRR